jgi:sRNA-binding carbon storage regulator CsrA
MIFDLSAGDAIHIGDAVTLTVLAVEDDLIRFGLETPEEGSPGAGEIGKDNEAADLKHGPNGWESN